MWSWPTLHVECYDLINTPMIKTYLLPPPGFIICVVEKQWRLVLLAEGQQERWVPTLARSVTCPITPASRPWWAQSPYQRMTPSGTSSFPSPSSVPPTGTQCTARGPVRHCAMMQNIAMQILISRQFKLPTQNLSSPQNLLPCYTNRCLAHRLNDSQPGSNIYFLTGCLQSFLLMIQQCCCPAWLESDYPFII